MGWLLSPSSGSGRDGEIQKNEGGGGGILALEHVLDYSILNGGDRNKRPCCDRSPGYRDSTWMCRSARHSRGAGPGHRCRRTFQSDTKRSPL